MGVLGVGGAAVLHAGGAGDTSALVPGPGPCVPHHTQHKKDKDRKEKSKDKDKKSSKSKSKDDLVKQVIGFGALLPQTPGRRVQAGEGSEMRGELQACCAWQAYGCLSCTVHDADAAPAPPMHGAVPLAQARAFLEQQLGGAGTAGSGRGGEPPASSATAGAGPLPPVQVRACA